MRAGSHSACVRITLIYGQNTRLPGGPLHKLALLGLFAALQIGAADPRIGSWTLISAQSSLDPPNKLSITSVHGAVHVAISGEKHLDFTAKVGGHETVVQGNPAFNQIELRKIDRHQVELIQKKDGAVVATIHNKLSKDNNELTSTTSQNNHADQISVWTRSGGKKSATDLFAGEWTEDLSKTRMRQGLKLKIEPDGKDGVQFQVTSATQPALTASNMTCKTPATTPYPSSLSTLTRSTHLPAR